jgi:hypothetical protein
MREAKKGKNSDEINLVNFAVAKNTSLLSPYQDDASCSSRWNGEANSQKL